MTTFTRNILAFAIVAGFSMPAMAGQSANRTGTGASTPPQAATKTAPESPSAAKCRQHCGSLAASGPHQPHRNVADNTAQSADCLRRMAN
jgi:hypothetical protein